jgi:hypothetical protein
MSGTCKRAHKPYSALIDHAYWIHSLSILFTHRAHLSSPLQPEPLASHPPTSTGASNNCRKRRCESLSRRYRLPPSRSPRRRTNKYSAIREATATLSDLMALMSQYSVGTSRQDCLRTSPKSPPTLLFRHIPSPPILPCPTPSSYVYSVDCKDDSWSLAIGIGSVHPPGPPPASCLRLLPLPQ